MRLPEVLRPQPQRIAIIAVCSPLVAVVLTDLLVNNALEEEAFGSGRRAGGHGKDTTTHEPKL